MHIRACAHWDKCARMSVSALLVTTMKFFLKAMKQPKCQSVIHFYPFKQFECLSMSRCSLSFKKITSTLTADSSPPSGHPGCA